jgi:glycosyltransferase involved in cell wall biosynthesis
MSGGDYDFGSRVHVGLCNELSGDNEPVNRCTSYHVLAPDLIPGDAIAQDALGMFHTLRGRGATAFLYAQNIDARYAGLCRHLSHYQAGPWRRPDDVLIYHHGVGWELGLEIYATTRNRRVLKYHNVTPAQYFQDNNEDHFQSCVHGSKQTQTIARVPAECWLGDSDYNVGELLKLAAGPGRVETVPPFHDLAALNDVEADVATLRRYRDGSRNFLFVGRVMPHKGHIDLIKTLAYYRRFLHPRSRLVIAGELDPRLDRYQRRLSDLIRREGLEGAVVFTGKLNRARLKACYLASDTFLCASRHEGFCVPLVEAMSFNLPCVAWGTTAVTETLGPDAVVWKELDYALLAEALHACVEDAELGDFIVERQFARYQQLFSPPAIARRFMAALGPTRKQVAV